MPQLAKGGKYVFGWSKIGQKGEVQIPAEAVKEYELKPGEKVILISGSKTSGGFVVAKRSLIEQSAIPVLAENPDLANYKIAEGTTIKFKGRLYSWTRIRGRGQMTLPPHTLDTFQIKPGDHLLSIRGSNVGFVMGVKGPIIEKAKLHPELQAFE